jgi:hypothetical protein
MKTAETVEKCFINQTIAEQSPNNEEVFVELVRRWVGET